ASGPHMALLAALTAGMAEFEGTGGNPTTPSNVQAAVAMAVPADLLALTPENKVTVGKFLGSIPEQNAEAWRRASPISHARPDGPPVLLLTEPTTIPFLPASRRILPSRTAGRAQLQRSIF